MFRSALKLVWNRRRVNRLVVIEIAAAFLITFVLTAIAVDLVGRYRRPIGFEYENVLSVTIQSREATGGYQFSFTPLQQPYPGEDVLAALRALPQIETAEPIFGAPYRGASRYEGGLLLSPVGNQTTAEALQAIGVELVAGRWFGSEDEGQDYRAMLVNRTFAEQAFGSVGDAVGQRIDRPDEMPGPQGQTSREARVVGVIEEFRHHGELSATRPYVIEPWDGAQRDERRIATFTLLVKTVPGTDAGVGEQIVATVESVAPGWLASVTPWEQLRASYQRLVLLPLKAVATIAAFFIALVVMGVIGVLWQDVVRRTQEIGLRRAVGASAASVRRQIQLEAVIVGAFGTLIGAGVAIQFPLLELVGLIDWRSSIPALALSAAAILTLVMLGALYPSRLASRREPADALRYE